MKKIVLGILVTLFLSNTSYATTVVHYNNAGARVSVTRGTGAPKSAHNFGSNALFLSSNPQYHKTYRNHPNFATGNYANPKNRPTISDSSSSVANTTTPSTNISRLNRAYSVKQAQVTSKRNGITYYN
jgi:hypothetical protein